MSDEAEQLKELLNAHRRTTGLALTQRALSGKPHVAPSIEATIDNGRTAIQKVKEALRTMGHQVDDLPIIDDASDVPIGNPDTVTQLHNQVRNLENQFQEKHPKVKLYRIILWILSAALLLISIILGFRVLQLISIVAEKDAQISLVSVTETAQAAAMSIISSVRPSIAVDAAKDNWQPTGIMVERGDLVVIRVTGGLWTPYNDPNEPNKNWEWSDGRGYAGPCSTYVDPDSLCPVSNYTMGALVARIGNTKYGIGPSCIFKATDMGILHMRMNDNNSDNNVGVLAVTVTIEQNVSDIPSDTCGKPLT
jgi:hypothetical protein